MNPPTDLKQMIEFCPKCQAETERGSRGRCKPCAQAYSAAYRIKNPEQMREWYAANFERLKAPRKAWQKNNPKKLKIYADKWRVANREKVRANSSKWAKANPSKVKAIRANFIVSNPDALRINDQNRRAKKRANGGTLSKGLSTKLFNLQQGKCPCCGLPLGDYYHLDHKMPIALGGPNIDSNMQLLRSICNKQKWATHPIDFMQRKGFLL